LALELSLLSLPNRPILDCAVVGVPSAAWGQAVGAVIVLSKEWEGEEGKGKMSVKELRALLRDEVSSKRIERGDRGERRRLMNLVTRSFAAGSLEASPVRQGLRGCDP